MPQGSVVLSLLGGLFLFVLVLVLAWYCSRWLGGRFGFTATSGNLRVLERVMVGPDRSLLVVRAGEDVLLLGVTPQHIERLCDLDPDLYPEEEEPPGVARGVTDFSAALQNAVRGWMPGKKQGNENEDE